MVEGNKAQAVIKELRLDPAIQTLHTTNGKWDLLVEIQSDNLVNFDLILSRIRSISGIYNSETNILLSTGFVAQRFHNYMILKVLIIF